MPMVLTKSVTTLSIYIDRVVTYSYNTTMQSTRPLREYRRSAVLSIRELAQKAGVSPTTISRIERGLVHNVWPATMRSIADALAVNADDITEFAASFVTLADFKRA